MRQHVALLLWTSTLAGCSLIYNPSNLPEGVPIDAPIADADPTMLVLEEVKSPPLLEGAGQSGSAPQILVVFAKNLIPQATLQIAPKEPNANVRIEVSDVTIAKDGNSIAALVRADYMDTVDETAQPIPLVITVAEPGAQDRMIEWTLRPLDELTTAGTQNPPAPDKLFSRVDVTGSVNFTANQGRAIVKAVGGIHVTMAVTANADNTSKAPGAGGCAGGDNNTDGECAGGGKSGGGGAGFVEAGKDGGSNTGGAVTGDELVKVYDGSGTAMNRGSGGGGGGGHGGGGGGTIELTAGGDIDVSSLSANAADGAAATVGYGGGGGAGGVVVLRAGGTLKLPQTISLAGGAGGNGTIGLGDGGAGSVGRWRFDAVTVSGTAPATPAGRRGPMLVRPANPIFNTGAVMVTVAGKTGDEIMLYTLYPDDTSDSKTVRMTMDNYLVAPPPLHIGLNTVCVVVGNFANDEAKNCIEVAFIP